MKRALTSLWLFLWLLIAAPVMAAPAVVQASSFNSASNNGTVTLGGAPTTGNLVIGWVSSANNGSGEILSVLNTASWTVVTSNQALFNNWNNIVMLYRYVQPGDTAALPALLTTAKSFVASQAVEISGVNGTFSNDFEHFDFKADQQTTTVTTNAYLTQTANDLVVTGAFSNTGPGNLTGFSGWTLNVQTNGANYGAWALASKVIASAGTSISTTMTPPTTSRPTGYISFVISGNGTGSAQAQASKMNAYPILQYGNAASLSSSKMNTYDVLQAGNFASVSASKMNTYFILQSLPAPRGFFHSFPP